MVFEMKKKIFESMKKEAYITNNFNVKVKEVLPNNRIIVEFITKEKTEYGI